MNRTTFLFLLPVAFLGFACERHSAESLPSHGGGHAVAHEGASSSHEAPHGEAAKSGVKPENAEKTAPVLGEAPKFFDGSPSK